MRIGVDTYCFHRLLGFQRFGEDATTERLADGGPAAIAHAVQLGAEVVSVQTCFAADDVRRLDRWKAAAAGADLVVSWGAPDGLAAGTSAEAEVDLVEWMEAAAGAGVSLVRIVVGGPSRFGLEPSLQRRRRLAPVLDRLARRAESLGVVIAIENHGDITAADLREIVMDVASPAVGVCFDTANAVRVGDDVCEAADLLAGWVRMVHLKDVEDPSRALTHESGPCSVPYGEGVVPVDLVLSRLSDPIAAGAPVCVELGQLPLGADEAQLVRASIGWLQAYRAGVGSPSV